MVAAIIPADTFVENNLLYVGNNLGEKIGVQNAPTITNPLYSDLRLGLESLIAREVFELSEEEFEYVKGFF